MTDSDSPPPITFGQTLWNIVFSSKYSSFEPKIDFKILGIWWRIRIPHPRLPLVKLYGISSFPQKTPPLTQKSPTEFWVTDDGFRFPTPDYLWSNFMEYRPFLKRLLLWPKNRLRNFGYLMTDSDSPSPITFGQTLWNIVLSSKYFSFDPKNRLRNFEGDGEGKQKGDREWWDLIGWILSVLESDWLVFSTNGRAHKQTSNFCFLYSSFQDWELINVNLQYIQVDQK
jgi:hypothetical protein